jgi:glycosyltransferase involved in cell wall biosynthesis
MRILLISIAFPPENSPGASRGYGFARYWSEAGQDVWVLTTPKPVASSLELPMSGFRVVPVENRGLATLRAARRLTPRVDSLPRRIARRIREATGVYSCARMPDETEKWVRPAGLAARDGSPWDVVVSCSGPYTVHRVAHELRRAGLARLWVMDFRDLWTRNHCYPGLFPFTILERRLERTFLREANLVTTVSQASAVELARLGATRVCVVPNGHDPDLEGPEPATTLPPGDRIVLVYTGSLYPRGQDPRPLLRALAALGRSRPELASRIRVVVAGPTGARWEALAYETGASAFVENRGVVTRQEAHRLQREASCLLFVDWQPSSAGVMTSKIYEYLFAKAPILAVGGSSDSAVAQLLREAGRGHHLGQSEVRIRELVEQLALEPARLATVPQWAVIQRYQRKTLALDLLGTLKDQLCATPAA